MWKIRKLGTTASPAWSHQRSLLDKEIPSPFKTQPFQFNSPVTFGKTQVLWASLSIGGVAGVREFQRSWCETSQLRGLPMSAAGFALDIRNKGNKEMFYYLDTERGWQNSCEELMNWTQGLKIIPLSDSRVIGKVLSFAQVIFPIPACFPWVLKLLNILEDWGQ